MTISDDMVERLRRSLDPFWHHTRNDLIIEAMSEIKRLRAALEGSVAVPAWQEISTAPRDGSEVLLCDARVKHLHMVAGWEQDIDGFSWLTADGQYHDDRFTHWQPLPEPPAITRQERLTTTKVGE
jgi:hypothetical protein